LRQQMPKSGKITVVYSKKLDKTIVTITE
jgi:hypothetical protein